MSSVYKAHSKRLVALAAFSIGISACGGGGGSSSVDVTETATSNVKLNGKAAKGIISAGIVVAKELDSSGESVAIVGNAITDSDGRYKLKLDKTYTGGPVQVSITSDVNTRMKCDVPAGCGNRTDSLADTDITIDFGEWYKPSSIMMTALLPGAGANDQISVNITPFTHMAAQRAMTASGLSAKTITDANSEVSNLLGGIDVLNTPPVDITNSRAVEKADVISLTYAALASSLANQGLTDANGQPELNAAINLLADSFLSGAIDADDVDGDDAAQISLQEIVDGASEAYSEIAQLDLSGTLTSMQALIDIAESAGGVIDPEPGTASSRDNLQKVKSLVSDIRTWGHVISIESDEPANIFSAELTMANDAVNLLGADHIVDALKAGIDAALNFNSNESDLSKYVLSANSFTAGTITSPSPGVISITGGVINDANIDIVFSLPEDYTVAKNFSLGIDSALITTSENRFVINNGIVNVSFEADYTVDYAAINSHFISVAKPNSTDLIFDLDVEFTQTVDSRGAPLASAVTFAGILEFDLDLVPLINNAKEFVLPKTFSLSGEFSNDRGDSLEASLAVNVDNTATFTGIGDAVPNGSLYSENNPAQPAFLRWSYLDTDGFVGDDTFEYVTPVYSMYFYFDAGFGISEITYTYLYNGQTYQYSDYVFGYESLQQTLDEYMYFSSGIYALIDNQGLYFADLNHNDFSQSGTADAVMVDADFVLESSNNWIDVDMGLTFMAQLDGLPEARFNITADRSGESSGNASITIAYGNRQLILSGNITSNGSSAALTIVSQDGAVLSVIDTGRNDFEARLSYNGQQYGTIRETESGYLKTTYNDGTFEIF